MTFSQMTGLFVAMLVLAMVPSPSVFAVMARSLGSGFLQGCLTALGIVTGDIVFIGLAISGLSLILESASVLFLLIKYGGGAYLISLGIGLWRSQPMDASPEALPPSSSVASFVSGLLITLSDPKAILFYVSFFPAFIDLDTLTPLEVTTLFAIALVAVGGAKILYAFLAHQSKHLFHSQRMGQLFNRVAGIVMILTGFALILKT